MILQILAAIGLMTVCFLLGTLIYIGVQLTTGRNE